MKTVFEHIEHVRAKPHHIRKRIAFASATIGTTIIALVWFIGSLSMGSFSIKGSSFAASMGQGDAAVGESGATGNQGLAGVGAAAALQQSADAPAHIEIVNAPAASAKQQAEETTLPF